MLVLTFCIKCAILYFTGKVGISPQPAGGGHEGHRSPRGAGMRRLLLERCAPLVQCGRPGPRGLEQRLHRPRRLADAQKRLAGRSQLRAESPSAAGLLPPRSRPGSPWLAVRGAAALPQGSLTATVTRWDV